MKYFNALLLLSFAFYSWAFISKPFHRYLSNQPVIYMSIPRERVFEAQQIELLRILGRVDIFTENEPRDQTSDISIRIFEARLVDGTKCFLKEYSPGGVDFGKKELSITRKLSTKWLNYQLLSEENQSKSPFFPPLLGSLITDIRIETEEFRYKWRMRFPSSRPPESGNLWLIFPWTDSTFRTIRRYPSLPQVVEGLDYFSKERRDIKRWKFIRKIMKKTLESLDYLHRSGYCHNTISSECIWLSTTNQQEINNLYIVLSELGSCEKFSDLGPYAKKGINKDLYNLGLIFLELIISSYTEDNIGAQKTRALLANEEYKLNIFAKVEEMDYSQLRRLEWKDLFEKLCQSDFAILREYVGTMKEWKEGYEFLERDEGLAWRLIFYLLASGRLYDDDKQKPLRISPRSILKQFKGLFLDV